MTTQFLQSVDGVVPCAVVVPRLVMSAMFVGRKDDPKGVSIYISACDCQKPQCKELVQIVIDAATAYELGSNIMGHAISSGHKPEMQS